MACGVRWGNEDVAPVRPARSRWEPWRGLAIGSATRLPYFVSAMLDHYRNLRECKVSDETNLEGALNGRVKCGQGQERASRQRSVTKQGVCCDSLSEIKTMWRTTTQHWQCS